MLLLRALHAPHPGWGWGEAPRPRVWRDTRVGIARPGAAVRLVAPGDAHGAGGQPEPAAPAPAGDFPLGGDSALGLQAWWCLPPPRDPHIPMAGGISAPCSRDPHPLPASPPLAEPAAPLPEAGALPAPACPPARADPPSPALQHWGGGVSWVNWGCPRGSRGSRAGLRLSHGGGIPRGQGLGW